MQVFDDPSIQNGPKLTNRKKQSIGGTQKPKDSEGTRLPPGLPMARGGLEETKRWKSTRETQNFQVKSGNSRLQTMKESSS